MRPVRGYTFRRMEQTNTPGAHPSPADPVLLVEDEALIAMMVEDQLAELGYRAVLAPTVAAARALIDQAPRFRFALVDLKLPDGSGCEVIRHLWASQPGAPVVVTTGYAEPPEPAPLPETAGPWAVLLKPWGLEALEKALATLGVDPRAAG